MTTTPLTPPQRNWLVVNAILPPVFAIPMLAVVGAALWFIDRRFGAHPAVKVFAGLGALLLLVVAIAVALHVANNVRDLRAGVARVEVARLVRKYENGRSPKSQYAELERVGRVIVMSDVYALLHEGRAYRVTFSERTRRCWSASAE